MRLLIASLRKEARRSLRDPFALALWLGIPFSILFLMNLAFGGGGSSSGPRPQGVLLVADQDESFLSGMVVSAFSQGPLGEMFKPEKTAEPDGRARMAKGEASALIILPKGFQDAVLDNRPAAIRLVKNPSQRILPAIAGETLTMLSEAVHYLHLVAGDEIRMVTTGGTPSNAQVAQTSVAINTAITQLKEYIDPPLLDFEMKAPPAKAAPQRVNLLAMLFPGIVFMSLLFMGRGASDDLWDELQLATLRRTQSAGLGLHVFLGGKLLSAVAISLFVAVLALGAGNAFAGLKVANWPAAIGWMMAGGAAWYLIMLILQIIAGARNRGEILTSFVLFPSMMLGGSMFSFAMMPDFIARIGKATPLGWMVVRFDLILQGSATAADVAAWLGIMTAVCALLFAAAAPALRWRFLKG